ncbi:MULTISPECIES: hypothetical protein [Leptolyngbya]|nr:MULTISPECIES: hypothetical protein [Leptolyngbya]MBD2406539.1 hypothetical protein [Leptolyngbya sp. FACHB-402]ULP32210.1 hypothetical protein MCP04_10675 [Leptolyngbya boryana IU 594]
MNKSQLLSALGMSSEAKAQKSQSTKRKAIEVHSRTLSEGNATKRAQIKGRITRAVKRELDAAKKSGKELSQDEKRAIAAKALAKEVKAIKAGKPEKQKPFGIQKPPHMSVAEYREHLRRKFDPNSSGSRVESIAKKEKQRSEIGSGEFEGRSTAENLRQMEQQGKVSYGKSGEQQSKPKTLGEGIKAYAEKVNELRRESARRGVSIALESDVLTHLKDQGYSQSQIKAIQGATDKLMGKISGRHGTVIHHDPDHPGFQKAIRDKTPLEKGKVSYAKEESKPKPIKIGGKSYDIPAGKPVKAGTDLDTLSMSSGQFYVVHGADGSLIRETRDPKTGRMPVARFRSQSAAENLAAKINKNLDRQPERLTDKKLKDPELNEMFRQAQEISDQGDRKSREIKKGIRELRSAAEGLHQDSGNFAAEVTEQTGGIKRKQDEIKPFQRKQSEDHASSPRQKLEAEAAKDPKLKQFLGLVAGKKLSDKQMREKLGVSQDELLQLGERSRKLLGITAMSTFKEGLARMYGDTGSKSRSTTPKPSPRLIEKTVDGRKRYYNRSGSEVVRGRSID